MTRRRFLEASAALPFAMRSFAETPSFAKTLAAPRWIFLGTDTGKGIYRARWNAATGEAGPVELAVATQRPTYLAMHPKLPVLYASQEAPHGDGGLASFQVNAKAGELRALRQVSSRGAAPCYVSIDATGQSAFVANYNSGSLAAFDLGATGEPGEAATMFECRQNPACGTLGPVKDRQDAPHLHCATISPDNDFVLVCNLGEDAIEVFPITPDTHDPLGKPMRVAAPAGSGPRHVAFHSNRRWVYCIHELGCTIDLYDWSVQGRAATMTLRRDSAVSTLAKGSALKGNTAGEIIAGDDGRFVYACTRGENSLAVYRVDAATGLLHEQQRLSCGGKVPRYIAFDPSRRWLLCANQGTGTSGSGNLTVFAHDAATGRLSETPKTFEAETPMFVQFV